MISLHPPPLVGMDEAEYHGKRVQWSRAVGRKEREGGQTRYSLQSYTPSAPVLWTDLTSHLSIIYELISGSYECPHNLLISH